MRPERLLDRRERRVHRGVVGHVADDRHGADALGQRLGPALVRLDVGDGQLRALGGQLGGDAEGDGVAVGQAHHQALLALHQIALGQVELVGQGQPSLLSLLVLPSRRPRPAPRAQPSWRLITRQPLVPPKPKLLDITVFERDRPCARAGSAGRRRPGRGCRCWRSRRRSRPASSGGSRSPPARPTAPEAVAGQGLGRGDQRRIVAEHLAHRLHLADVADLGRGAVRIQIVDVRGRRRSPAPCACSAPRLRRRARPCRSRRNWRHSR